MRVLIISDTHGDDSTFMDLYEKCGDIDMLIHCGDVCGSEALYRDIVKCPVKMVTGNNDFYSDLKDVEEFDLLGHHVLVTHGHRLRVSWGTERLMEYAYNNGADIIIYGHTHVPVVEYDEDFNVHAINPGSLTYPRQPGHKASYAILEIDKNDEIKIDINFL